MSSATVEVSDRVRPENYLEQDELDTILENNQDWIIPTNDKNTVFRIDEYINLHDENLRPLLRDFLE
jgi:hypothetical protein